LPVTDLGQVAPSNKRWITIGDHAKEIIDVFHLDASVNLVETLLEVVDIAVGCDKDVDSTGESGSQDVVVIRVFRTGDRLRVPLGDLGFGEILI